MEQEYKYMVRVSCITYNQAPYIEDTMNGFCMQETSFPFVCTILDDASTDGEPEVIKQYLAEHFDLTNESVVRNEETEDYYLTFAQHRTNKNCYFAVLFLKYNHYSINKSKKPYIEEWTGTKYVAICEGDDYWIHPRKLLMQVEFLEKHADYMLCHTDFEATIKRRSHYREKFKDDVYFPNMLNDGFSIGTLTVMYRKAALDAAPKYFNEKRWPMGDKPMWYELASLGKVKYLPEVTAMYRIVPNSASHFDDIEKQIQFKKVGLEIRQFYAEKYGVKLKNDGYDKSYFDSMLSFAFKFNDINKAEKFYLEARNKRMISIKGKLFYLGTKSLFVRKIISLLLHN